MVPLLASVSVEFLAVFVALYSGHLVAYFALGGALMWLNARHPDRRIQKGRHGEIRARTEIIQSIKALVPLCAMMAAGLTLQRHGITLWPPLPLNLPNALGLSILSIVLFDAWFYWAHRLMHWPPMFKFHRLHHKSIAPTPWSNYSDDLVDATVHQGFLMLAPLILPIPPVILIAHRLYDHINGQIGHAGFEYFAGPTARHPWPFLCTTFHDQHHSRFHYNYGNFFSLWDRLCGTIAPDYDSKVQALTAAKPERRR